MGFHISAKRLAKKATPAPHIPAVNKASPQRWAAAMRAPSPAPVSHKMPEPGHGGDQGMLPIAAKRLAKRAPNPPPLGSNGLPVKRAIKNPNAKRRAY